MLRADSTAPRGDAQTNVLYLTTDTCPDEFTDTLYVELRMENLDQLITGVQAFLQFDPSVLSFNGVASCYTKCEEPFDAPCGHGPFQLHFPSNIASAGVFTGAQPGQLNITASTSFFGDCTDPTQADALLAILVFDILSEDDCTATTVTFRDYGGLNSQFSFQGNPVPTTLRDTGLIALRGEPIMIESSTPSIDRCEGGEAVFEVALTGCGPFTYQWSKDDVPLEEVEDISGVQGPLLIISTLTASATGDYTCRISSPCGEMTTPPATLVIHASGSGDTNLDTVVNGLDIQDFLHHLLSGTPASASYCAADMNQNGLVEASDVEPFVNLLLAQ